MYVIEICGLLTCWVVFELYYVIHNSFVKGFEMVVFFIKSHRFSGQVFDLIFSFVFNVPLRVVLDDESLQGSITNLLSSLS